MILAHTIALKPTPKQERAFRQAAGTARYTWNWALAECERHYKETGKSCNIPELRKRWNSEKPDWVYESPKDANQRPFTNLYKAWQGFFTHKAGKPRFKKKGIRDSFYVSNDKFAMADRKVRLSVIGWVKMRESLRFVGKILSGTVCRVADRWFLSIQIEIEGYKKSRTGDGIIGVDLGITTAATLSTGEAIPGPRPLKKALNNLRRLSRWHSRKKKGSKNRDKFTRRLARIHARIANIRKDFLHKLTTRLCRENQTVVIEDLAVGDMLKNHKLALHMSDLGFGEFRRQMAYKSVIYNNKLIVADRWFPSSQLCSQCGHRMKMPLGQRMYRCPVCGLVLDRDVNAALNLCTLGHRGINACGQEGSGSPVSVKAEPAGKTILDETGTFNEGVHICL